VSDVILLTICTCNVLTTSLSLLDKTYQYVYSKYYKEEQNFVGFFHNVALIPLLAEKAISSTHRKE
jgi:hypothetical protein